MNTPTNKDTAVIILAAGRGSRMHSKTPKVLRKVGNKSILEHVLSCVGTLDVAEVCCVIPNAADSTFTNLLDKYQANYIAQTETLGTAHAVYTALSSIKSTYALVLCADVPCIQRQTLQTLLENAKENLGIITANLTNPSGYGRIIRTQDNAINAIVEEKDCDATSKKITEIYSGIGVFPVAFLKEQWPNISNNNAQQEYYLTDYIKLWAKERSILSHTVTDAMEIQGVNTPHDLAKVERHWQYNHAVELLKAGVHILDPMRFDNRGDTHIAPGTTIDINCIFNETVRIGKNCHIGANVILENVTVADNVTILPNTILRNSVVESHASIGPYTFAKNDTYVGEHAKLGSFVETKTTHIAPFAKASHLAYLGNLHIKSHVNIGAGVIHCNYNGVEKFTSTIESYAFIGANSQLVGPITIGEHATIGAGSTITKDAPANKLTLTRSAQKTLEHWQSPRQKQASTNKDCEKTT